MTWVFAAVVVLALGAIAVVASGVGAPMDQVRPDRPGHHWQPGAITASDLRRARFSTAVRGYRMDEVDALLAALAQQLEAAEASGGGTAAPGAGAGEGTGGDDAARA